MMAIKLGEENLVQHTIESVPYSNIELCVTSMPQSYINRCLKFIITFLENSKHIQFYLTWVQHILTIHGAAIKGPNFLPILMGLQKNLTKCYDSVGKL